MKKSKNEKKSKASKQELPLPGLVEAMVKLVERLEALERKTDQVLGRVSNIPSEIRNAVANTPRQNTPQHQATSFQRPDQGSSQGQGPAHSDIRKDRILYQAVCADCRKQCEVPFKPGDRPVYCKECFSIRKAGHRSQDPDRKTSPSSALKKAQEFFSVPTFTPQSSGKVALAKGRKQKPNRNQKAKSKKKK